MKTPTYTSLTLFAAWALLAGDARAQGSPYTIEVGEVDEQNGNQVITWYDADDAPIGDLDQFLKLRVGANVGDWVYVLVDARLKVPETQDQEYDDFVAAYPFLEPAEPFTVDPQQPDVVVDEDNVFQPAIDAVHLPAPVAPPDPASIRRYFQPIVGMQSGPAKRIFDIDPKTWVADDAEAQLALWLERSYWRDPDADTPENLDVLSSESLWQSALEQKGGQAAADFLRTQQNYVDAIGFGLELAVQAIVYTSTQNNPAHYTPSNEAIAPGLEGVGTQDVSLIMTEPIVFGVRVNDGGGGGLATGARPHSMYVFNVDEPGYVWVEMCPSYASWIVLQSNTGQNYVRGLKYVAPGLCEFAIGPGMVGQGHIVGIGSLVHGLNSNVNIPYAISIFGQ